MINIKASNKMLNNHSAGVSVKTTIKNKVYVLLFLTCVFVYAPQFAWGQKVLKTHTGQATDDGEIAGTLKYTYYEKDYERIKEGDFSFAYSQNGVSSKLVGKFKEGLRDGIWTHSIGATVSGSNISIISLGYYNKGIPDGNWKQTSTMGGKPMSEIVILLKNGKFVNFNANNSSGFDYGYYKVKKTTFKFDANGQPTENYIQFLDGQEETSKYSNGILAFELARNAQGEVISKKEYITDLTSLDKGYVENKPFSNIYNGVILTLFGKHFATASVFGGVKEDIKCPTYIYTLTQAELEANEARKQANQKEAEKDKNRELENAKREQEKEALRLKLNELKQNVSKEYKGIKIKSAELLAKTNEKAEKKKNGFGRNLLAGATDTEPNESNAEFYHKKLVQIIEYKQKGFDDVLFGYNAESYLSTEEKIQDVKSSLNLYNSFLDKALLIAYDGENHPQFGKVKVNKSFFQKLRNTNDIGLIDKMFDEAEIEKKK